VITTHWSKDIASVSLSSIWKHAKHGTSFWGLPIQCIKCQLIILCQHHLRQYFASVDVITVIILQYNNNNCYYYHYSAQVVAYKRLRGGVEFLSEIPRSASGKILRRQLKELTKSPSTDTSTFSAAMMEWAVIICQPLTVSVVVNDPLLCATVFNATGQRALQLFCCILALPSRLFIPNYCHCCVWLAAMLTDHTLVKKHS